MVKKIFGKSYIALILLLMYAPILLLITFSFTDSKLIGTWNGISFVLYKDMVQNEELMTALYNTILIAVVSSLCSTVLGTIGAIGIFYSKRRFKRVMNGLNQIPVLNAEIVTAIALTILFVALGIEFSFFTLLIGHMVLTIPFVVLSVIPKLNQLDPNTYEAALDLGATPRKALWSVISPEIRPGVFSGFLLAITLSLDDFVITQFTTGPGLLSAGDPKIVTLSILIQDKIKKGPIPPVMRALTTIIFLLVVLGVVGVTIYRRFQDKKVVRKARRA